MPVARLAQPASRTRAFRARPIKVLSEEADATRESASALVTVDRRDLDAAWHVARTPLDASDERPEIETNSQSR